MQNKVYSYFGLINRAGKLTSGETLIKDIQGNKVNFVIICNDASENTKKKISDKCKFYHVDYIIYGEIKDLSNAIGKKRVAIGVKDEGFSHKLKLMIGG